MEKNEIIKAAILLKMITGNFNFNSIVQFLKTNLQVLERDIKFKYIKKLENLCGCVNLLV